jgi:hypothetical protein
LKHIQRAFRTKELGPTTFCLGIEFTRIKTENNSGLLVHQSGYISKLLEQFHSLGHSSVPTPLRMHSIHPDTDIYGLIRKGEELLYPGYPYIAAIQVGVVLYLAEG